MAYFLGIDVGTSGLKSVLTDERGRVAAAKTVEYPLYQPKNGWAEQDPEDWVSAAAQSIRGVLEVSGVPAEDIVSVGLTGQMHGLVLLDAHNRVLRRAILWCDGRSAAECGEITERAGGRKRLIELCANPAIAGFTASKALWVRNNEPEIWSRAVRMLLPKDYLRLRLCGVYASDVSDASGMQLFDVAHRRWSDELCRALDIPVSMLPEVYESPEVCGRITPDAAALTGLKVGTPVVAGAGDNAASAVGMGVVHDGDAFVSIGSSGVVFAHTSEPRFDADGRAHTFCCAVPGKWHMMGVTQGAGLSLKWFRDTLAGDLRARAEHEGRNVYAVIDEEAERSPIGSNRLVFLPYLMGERTPHLDPSARGVFFGLSASHTLGDLARAVMEGVTFSLRDCLEVLGDAGVRPTSLIACGGGGTSALWRDMLCSALETPIDLSPSAAEGAAFGAAVLAAAESFGSVESACAAMTSRERACVPDAQKSAAYRPVYGIYRSLYPVLRENYTNLESIG